MEYKIPRCLEEEDFFHLYNTYYPKKDPKKAGRPEKYSPYIVFLFLIEKILNGLSEKEIKVKFINGINIPPATLRDYEKRYIETEFAQKIFAYTVDENLKKKIKDTKESSPLMLRIQGQIPIVNALVIKKEGAIIP
jgi:hypothetical protein